jgi:GAF domain-containing protein
VARLRRVFGELRSGLISATVALNLMHLISESFERAVLFLVKRDHLAVLGAFGVDPGGRPLAELLRGIKLPLEHGDALTRGVRSGEVQVVDFAAADLSEPLRSRVGAPRSGQLVVFPVLGAERVIAVVYADNGERPEKPRNIEILELAAAQVGIAFENELLRRQIASRKD